MPGARHGLSRVGSALPLLLTFSLLAGCTSIFTVRIPLGDGSTPMVAGSPAITIDDQRPASARKVQAGGGLSRCERWYGDDTYVPSKIEYLRQRLAENVPANATLTVTLRRFDTIEYCDNTASRAGAAAAYGASAAAGSPVYVSAGQVPGGDSVLVRVTGEINGVPFDASRRFDYDDLPFNALTELPAANPRYRERMTRALNEIARELAALPGYAR